MTRLQYLICIIALFLLTALFLFPARRYSENVLNTPSRGFLFGEVYVERQEPSPVGVLRVAEVHIDYPRIALESIVLASTTAFFVLLCRPRRYAD